MTINKDMMRALAVNAARHLTDADLHLKRSNIRSAMASAAFGIEELQQAETHAAPAAHNRNAFCCRPLPSCCEGSAHVLA